MKKLSVLIIAAVCSFCFAQEDPSVVFLAAQYDSLISIVREKGAAAEDSAHSEMTFEWGDLRFSHKIISKDMEALTVADFRTNVFYWVIKEKGKVFIETKDYTPDIAERKFREAKIHFPGVLKNMLSKIE